MRWKTISNHAASCCSLQSRERFGGLLRLLGQCFPSGDSGAPGSFCLRLGLQGMSNYSLATFLHLLSTTCTDYRKSRGPKEKHVLRAGPAGQQGQRSLKDLRGSPKELLGSPDNELGTQWRAYVHPGIYVTILGSSNLKGQRSLDAAVTLRANTVCHFPGT